MSRLGTKRSYHVIFQPAQSATFWRKRRRRAAVSGCDSIQPRGTPELFLRRPRTI